MKKYKKDQIRAKQRENGETELSLSSDEDFLNQEEAENFDIDEIKRIIKISDE